MEDLEVVRMGEEDIEGAIQTIWAAFSDDPYNREKSSRKVLGTAMWLAPHPVNQPESWFEYFGAWKLWFGQVYMNLLHGRGGLNTRRYWLWKAAQAKAQGELWTDPRGYYFCNIVTVLPEAQGKGVGRLLMEAVLKEADAKGMPCYLESSRKVPNVAIYEKFGFELKRDMPIDDDGDAIMLYCMIREPKGDANSTKSTTKTILTAAATKTSS